MTPDSVLGATRCSPWRGGSCGGAVCPGGAGGGLHHSGQRLVGPRQLGVEPQQLGPHRKVRRKNSFSHRLSLSSPRPNVRLRRAHVHSIRFMADLVRLLSAAWLPTATNAMVCLSNALYYDDQNRRYLEDIPDGVCPCRVEVEVTVRAHEPADCGSLTLGLRLPCLRFRRSCACASLKSRTRWLRLLSVPSSRSPTLTASPFPWWS